MGKTFKQWCDENNRQDLLDRWDYDKTGFAPEDITHASAKPVYFKCPAGLHESEMRKVFVITSGAQNNFICKKCNKEWNRQLDDLTGRKFGELTVLKYDKERSKNSKQTYWICRCSCGVEKSIGAIALKSGSQITCGDRKIHWTGENATNWKGGVTDINKSIRASDDYYIWRNEVLKKDCCKCILCGDTKSLEVHHIYPFSISPHDRFNVNNGCVLCFSHHSSYAFGSFHNEYGTKNNTPEQFQEYVNMKRQELGITESFDIYKYMSSIYDDDMEIDDVGLDISSLTPDNILVNDETGMCSISIPLE